MGDIKPIPTRYKGYHFRSRLEARWAVFFDALGVKWEYEPEGYQLPSGWYLPDFLVQIPVFFWNVESEYESFTPDKDRPPRYELVHELRTMTFKGQTGAYVEIKPSERLEGYEDLYRSYRLLHELETATGVPSFMASGGSPFAGSDIESSNLLRKAEDSENITHNNCVFVCCTHHRVGGWPSPQIIGESNNGGFRVPNQARSARKDDTLDRIECIHIEKAIAAARSARFEHGESGAT